MAEALTVSPVPAGPKPFSIPTVNVDLSQEAEIRAISNAAEEAGDQTGNSAVPVPQRAVPQAPGVPAAAPQAAPVLMPTVVPQAAQPSAILATPDVPAKFVLADGTVDVEKLQASSKQLDTALAEKVLTVEEMVAQYKDKENKLRNLPNPNNPESIARFAQAQPAPQPIQAQMPQQPLPPDALQAQILADLQRDPVGTIVDLVKAVNSTENKPLHDFVGNLKERQKDEGMKNSLIQLVKEDPRVANPQIYQAVLAEMDADPGYHRLRNPYKAAWNEVKARLRLGDAQIPAQPSKTASPILGGGTPPPVPSTTGGYSPATIGSAIGQMKTKDEMSMVEAELRKLTIAAGM